MHDLAPSWHDLNPYPPDEHDQCPDCGQTITGRPRDHRCAP